MGGGGSLPQQHRHLRFPDALPHVSRTGDVRTTSGEPTPARCAWRRSSARRRGYHCDYAVDLDLLGNDELTDATIEARIEVVTAFWPRTAPLR